MERINYEFKYKIIILQFVINNLWGCELRKEQLKKRTIWEDLWIGLIIVWILEKKKCLPFNSERFWFRGFHDENHQYHEYGLSFKSSLITNMDDEHILIPTFYYFDEQVDVGKDNLDDDIGQSGKI